MMSDVTPLAPEMPEAQRCGADLRMARERLGWALDDIAAGLHIPLRHLEALEEGRIALLPGSAYAVGYVRGYASALGLDSEEMVRRFKAEAAEVGQRTELLFPAPMPDSGLPAGAVMLLNVAPLSVLGLLVTSPDVPSVFFWALGVMVLWALVRTQQTRLWYVLGVVFGLGLLSKYTVVLFGPCVLLFLLLTPERRWLRTPHPYLAVLLGLLLFTPVIYWNSQHDWISFRFQINHGLNPEAGSWNHIAAYVGGQVGVAGPITWLLGLWGTAAALLRRDKGSLLLVCMSLPVIAFFGITSWRTEAGPNWPALGYFTYFLLAASVLRAHSWQRATAWVLSLTTAAALSLIITVHARYTVLPDSVMSPAAREADATNWFHGWRELGQNLLARGAPVPIIAASHQLAAEIIYYTGEAWPVTVDPQARINQFNLWPSPTRPGQTADYIWVEGGAQSDVSAYFSAVQRESSLWVYRAGRVMRTYRIAEGTLRDTAAAKP